MGENPARNFIPVTLTGYKGDECTVWDPAGPSPAPGPFSQPTPSELRAGLGAKTLKKNTLAKFTNLMEKAKAASKWQPCE